jgi:hypothetical protein
MKISALLRVRDILNLAWNEILEGYAA